MTTGILDLIMHTRRSTAAKLKFLIRRGIARETLIIVKPHTNFLDKRISCQHLKEPHLRLDEWTFKDIAAARWPITRL